VAEQPLDEAVLRRVCDVLGETNAGLTNKEIAQLLTAAKIRDPTPRSAGAGTYVVKNKRDRLYDALILSQRETKSADAALSFIKIAMSPARYGQEPEVFESRQHDLNMALAWASLALTDAGRLRRTTAATSLTDARRRAARLRHVLVDRDAHPRLLAACVDEIRDDNYFHALLEGAKSIATEIRRRTGSRLDGAPLVQATCERTPTHPVPLLALNRLETQTERSRQDGFAAGLRAIFSAARNPTAHEPKILGALAERDAIDLLTQMSYLHRRLDECTDTGHLRQHQND
jgi:uncharacterized protein (TIGR02391 family)